MAKSEARGAYKGGAYKKKRVLITRSLKRLKRLKTKNQRIPLHKNNESGPEQTERRFQIKTLQFDVTTLISDIIFDVIRILLYCSCTNRYFGSLTSNKIYNDDFNYFSVSGFRPTLNFHTKWERRSDENK